MYFKRKGEIDPYITTFRYLIRVMKETEKIKILKIPEIGEYFDELGNILKTLRGFCKNSYILMSGQRLTGNLLELPLDYLRLFFHLDLIKFNSMLKIVKEHKKDFERLLEIIGFLDATIAIGAFRKSLSFYSSPNFLEENQQAHVSVRIVDLYHPMIDHPICNSISCERGILITGSNASGKSTFLKSVAINALLAQTIDTALAREFSTNFFRIYSSMALSDNLYAGESYYMVEIKSMKRVLDASKKDVNVLCFVDEVLRGTNTAERIAASSYILKELNRRNVICFAATHDIELTHILEEHFENYHFTEQVTDHDIYFPYQLYKGRTESRNAIKLLDLIGYEQNITSAAGRACENFIKNGVWGRV
jgi:DNA mismatch repair ATPase MutS